MNHIILLQSLHQQQQYYGDQSNAGLCVMLRLFDGLRTCSLHPDIRASVKSTNKHYRRNSCYRKRSVTRTLCPPQAARRPSCRGTRPIGPVSCHPHPERSGPSASLLSAGQGSHLELPCDICHSWRSRTSASITRVLRCPCVWSPDHPQARTWSFQGHPRDARLIVRVWL